MNDKKIYLRIFQIVKQYIKMIIFIMILLLIHVGMLIIMPLLQKELMDNGLLKGHFKTIVYMVLFLFVLQQGNSLLTLFVEKIRINLVADFRVKLENMSFQHLLKIKSEFFTNINQSELLSQIDVDINYLCNILSTNTFSVFSSILTLIGGMVSIFLLNNKLALLFLITLPLKYLIIHYHSKYNKKRMSIYIDKTLSYARWFSEFVAGILTIRLFGIEVNKQKEFAISVNEKIKSQKDLEMLSQYRLLAESAFNNIWSVLIYLVGGFMVVKDELSIGNIYAFISYSAFITGPLFSILNIKVIFEGVLPSAKRFFEFIDKEEEILNENNKMDLQTSNILFQNTTFSYGKIVDTESIIYNFNLVINENSKIALVGTNGSGKTTIINLLLRLYDYDSGKILLGNKDIKSLNLLKYREQFSIVSQNIYLFNDTIKNNICLYKDCDEKDLGAIIDDCGLTDLIREKGLNYVAGVNGAYLSGGQKQKIALARALFHNKQIFIFDEATSNTDIIFETLYHKIISERLKDKTVIIITHKLSILKEVDSVALIEDGKVVCQDLFDNLMRCNNTFMHIIDEYKKLDSI